MGRKTKIIGIRVDEEVDERLLRFEAETGIERVTLARNAMIAALKFFEENHRISFPIRMVEGQTDSKIRRPDSEAMAKLRPEDRGTPTLEVESRSAKTKASP